MLIDHQTRREHDEHDVPGEGESPRGRGAQMKFPTLEEPTWLEDDLDEEMEAPPDSSLRGMWIGIAAAAATFVLVFAIPQWLGWYDIGPPPQAKRDTTPESVISTVTARPSAPAVVETAPPAPALPVRPPTPAAPPAPALPARPTTPAPARETKPAATPAVQKVTPAASTSEATFWVQVGAFKNAGQAGKLAARVKRDGYPAEVHRLRGASVPWAVWVGTYPTREQAGAAQAALARKGLPGFIR